MIKVEPILMDLWKLDRKINSKSVPYPFKKREQKSIKTDSHLLKKVKAHKKYSFPYTERECNISPATKVFDHCAE